MSVLQRRLASSTYALLRSFERRIDKLDDLIRQVQEGKLTEEQLVVLQRRLADEDDVLDTKTAEEETAIGGREEGEVSEERLLESPTLTRMQGRSSRRRWHGSDQQRVELIGPVDGPGGDGPSNGMYALQKELRKRIDAGLDWLSIKSLPASRDAIPWFWNWTDRRYAAWWDEQGLPFIQGPNMLFINSGSPRIDTEECALLDAANCRAMFCHTEWYADLIRKHRGPANQSEIILWPYPIDPWPGEPLRDAYDLLIYAKNGHRPQLLEHLAEVFPRHIQVHYGQYQREQLFEAARRSRACAYLADDDHGPLALQEILLAGCPTAGVRTGAAFVRTGETGVVLDRLPPGRQCAESDDDVRALAVFLEAIEQAQALDRHSVRDRAARQFDTDRIVDSIIKAVNTVRLGGGIRTAASEQSQP